MKNRINALIKEAMLAKDQISLGILRVLRGEIERAEQDPKKGKVEVDDAKVYSIINSLLENANTDEKTILNCLLPTQLTDEHTMSIITDLVNEQDLKSKGMAGMGIVMKFFNENHSGSFDKRLVSSYTKELLT